MQAPLCKRCYFSFQLSHSVAGVPTRGDSSPVVSEDTPASKAASVGQHFSVCLFLTKPKRQGAIVPSLASPIQGIFVDIRPPVALSLVPRRPDALLRGHFSRVIQIAHHLYRRCVEIIYGSSLWP